MWPGRARRPQPAPAVRSRPGTWTAIATPRLMGTTPWPTWRPRARRARADQAIHFDTAYHLEQKAETAARGATHGGLSDPRPFEGASGRPATSTKRTIRRRTPAAAEHPASSLEHWAMSRAPKPEPGRPQCGPRGGPVRAAPRQRPGHDPGPTTCRPTATLAPPPAEIGRSATGRSSLLNLMKVADRDIAKPGA